MRFGYTTARICRHYPAFSRGFHAAKPPRAIYGSVCDLVGRTPIVKINKLAPPGVDLYAKLEYFNPLASVKDRLALGIIEDAEAKGLLKPGQTVVEASSGNTGIALAMVCLQRDIHSCARWLNRFPWKGEKSCVN